MKVERRLPKDGKTLQKVSRKGKRRVIRGEIKGKVMENGRGRERRISYVKRMEEERLTAFGQQQHRNREIGTRNRGQDGRWVIDTSENYTSLNLSIAHCPLDYILVPLYWIPGKFQNFWIKLALLNSQYSKVYDYYDIEMQRSINVN